MAVRGTSFDIPERQIVAMLGPNGDSKTTMMKILTGYLAPSEGSAAIGGYGVLAERMQAAPR
jgi:ABC-2 type transport system ATP-binding protein